MSDTDEHHGSCCECPDATFTAKDYRSDLKPIWCPGCGDFGVLTALHRALAAIGRPPHEIALVSGIGCSSRIPGYTTVYGFNSVHGRALPIAQGIKLANPNLLVIVAGGDGDGFSIGGGHVPHAIRRNMDLTYIVMDNQIYGLTKGQLSPTSRRGSRTASSSYGSLEDPVNPLLYCLAYGAGFVAQGAPSDLDGLVRLIEEGIRYPGFAVINVQSPCVTFGQAETQLKNQKGRMVKLSDMGHDPSDKLKAMAIAQEYGGEKIHVGVFYRNPAPPPTYGDEVRRRQEEQGALALPAERILELFQPGKGRSAAPKAVAVS
jgi:2-oxoglutarate ferredoxin oxidoreductase subunit beta